ncbi:MAG: protein kinase [Actinobacteria bacterium]|nr:protein kinase [Actinomycetota bacterium]
MVTKDDLLADRYRMQDDIARGGMGRVIAAQDERLHRQVAVKLLKDELVQDPRFVERFRREARAVAALSHPNIATVFDYGEDDDCHFIVMEYADGKDLSRVLREDGPMSVDRAAGIAAQVCNALAHAHAARVVHRDVKPANIIIGPGDRVKVTDFGIARAAGDATLTATGSVLGTAQYISPEQAAGGRVTPATDVYSMGIVLYEMLTGAVPFTGDSPVAVAMQQVNEEMPAPSSLNPDVPSSLDEVVARATRKDPAERYGDAKEMGSAIVSAGGETMDTGAGTAVLDAGAATTAVEESASTVWPIPGSRWNPQRLGRWVLVILGSLLLVALLMLIVRLAGSLGEPAPKSTPPAEATSTVTIPEEIIDVPYREAKASLESLDAGLEVTREFVEHDEERGTVIDSNPPPLTEVEEGAAVTLYVALGDEDDDDRGKGGGKGDEKGKKGKGDEGGDD